MPIEAVTADGGSLTLTDRVGAGAQGGVYRVQGSPLLAKLVVGAGDPASIAHKLDRMVRQGRAPRTVRLLGDGAEPPRTAWPLARIATRSGSATGFLMADLHHWYVPFDVFFAPQRRRAVFPAASWALGLAAARELSRLVADLHAEHYVIGDLTAGNLWLDAGGRVAVSDVDSFQFTDGEAFFACRVRTPGYTAPELVADPDLPPDENTDRFALGILIHRLLMCGVHPFAGVAPDGEYRGLDGNAVLGRTRLLAPAAVRMPAGTPPVAVLPRPVRALLKRCFGPGGAAPRSRPSAQEWDAVLSACSASRMVRQCLSVSSHCYPAETPWCPWCDLRAVGVDCFPPPEGHR
ncbi:protein kinase domain-containing protein [Catenulispora subtropica]|uniref:Protein kinase domain-containing protein n=1 Tax=Catenulispora subtropica TaxID=450798 RepID=A0ABN2R015_9ACTN